MDVSNDSSDIAGMSYTIPLNNMVEMSRFIAGSFIQAGDMVIDATCGRGRDTVWLAEKVGPRGHVAAFDIQEAAIESSRELAAGSRTAQWITFYNCSHELIKTCVQKPVRCAMFNLGYLPGGDRGIVTEPESTLKAMDQCLALLARPGIMCIVAYPHEQGREECECVQTWLASRDEHSVKTASYRMLNNNKPAPSLYAAWRL